MAELYQVYGLENDGYGNFDDRDESQESSSKHGNGSSGGHSSHSGSGGGNVQAQHYSPQIPQSPKQQPPAPVKEEFQNSPPYELKNYEKQPAYEPSRRNTSYSFWDRMSMKRPEVIKLGVFALVIVLAISLERIGTHYLGKYLSDNIFTDLQEVMLRLSYPIGVFLIIWIIKSL